MTIEIVDAGSFGDLYFRIIKVEMLIDHKDNVVCFHSTIEAVNVTFRRSY